MDILSKFAERLSELVFYSDKNKSELNTSLGCGNSTINHYLTGRHIPNLKMAVKLADYFNCTTDFLFGLEEENSAQSFKTCPPFGERLLQLCKENNITRAELRRRTNIAESVMRYWVQDRTTPSIENVVKIAKAFNCSVDYVLGREK